jgi:hypothetical protein
MQLEAMHKELGDYKLDRDQVDAAVLRDLGVLRSKMHPPLPPNINTGTLQQVSQFHEPITYRAGAALHSRSLISPNVTYSPGSLVLAFKNLQTL